MTPRLTALDLFAGTGWGVACQRLGIKESGVEIMPEAVATREANGMHTIYRDVWEGLADAPLSYDLLIASPPCQTFSAAGSGTGRAALNDVIEAIEAHAYKDPQALRDFGDKHDPRTALVLTPLAHVWRDRPRLVALEQVPTVLPVWDAYADVMRDLGYSVKVAVLSAEQYGVPQTRRRAILVARLDGNAHLPIPTHSRYHSRTPDRLDPGVRKWVSMADGLGWGPAELSVSPAWVASRPAPTVVGTRRSAGGMLIGRQMDDDSRRDNGGHQTAVGLRAGMLPGVRVSGLEGALLQSYPQHFKWEGSNMKQFQQIGNAVPPKLAEAILRALCTEATK